MRFSLLKGGLCESITWVRFERGDGAAVLLYDDEIDAVILVRQFRYPVFARIARDGPDATGSVGEGDNHLDVARQELMEEAGYRFDGDLEPISTFCVSPGAASEKIALFLGRVSQADRVDAGGGVGRARTSKSSSCRSTPRWR